MKEEQKSQYELESEAKKAKEILRAYYANLNKLEKTALMTSFGKMIPSKNNSNPMYTFGKASRMQRNRKLRTDFMYTPSSETSYKYTNSPKYGFGTSARKDLTQRERYAYYNQRYQRGIDRENVTHKWDRTVGGDIGVERRLKLNLPDGHPGPGKYNPKTELAKYYQGGAGYIGMRLKNGSIFKKSETGPEVAPTSYEIGNRSQFHKFDHSPKYSFGLEKRKFINRDNITKNETYFDYSSVGEQVLGTKESKPQYSFGKDIRFRKIIK